MSLTNRRCWQHASAEVWPRRGAEKWAVADGGWSMKSWGHSYLLLLMIQEESKIDGALGTQEMAKRVVFKQV